MRIRGRRHITPCPHAARLLRAASATATTLPAAALLAAALPAAALPAAVPVVPGERAVRLATTIALLARTTDGPDLLAEYAITVRPTGGIARATSLAVRTERPARWHSYVSACSPSPQDALRLTCDLGDVPGPTSVRMTLRAPRETTTGLGIVAVAGAANAVSQETASEQLPPPSQTPATPTISSPSETETAEPPKPRSEPRTEPLPAAAARPRPRAEEPAPEPQTPPIPPEQRSPQRPGAFQGLRPAVPVRPLDPPNDVPEQRTTPTLPQITAPLVAPPGSAAAVTKARAPSGDDTSQFSMTSMADASTARQAWVRVLGVIAVAEAAVLWLATALGLWRRRATAAAIHAGRPPRRWRRKKPSGRLTRRRRPARTRRTRGGHLSCP